jgi:WD40 repeat protein
VCSGRITRIAVAPDGNTVAIANGGEVSLWNMRSATRIADLPIEGVVAFSPAGEHLFSLDVDGRITEWDLASRTVAKAARTAPGGRGRELVAVDDGTVLALTTSSVERWNPADDAGPSSLFGVFSVVGETALSPGGSLAANLRPGQPNTIEVFKLPAGTKIFHFPCGEANEPWSSREVSALALSPDDGSLAVGTEDRRVQLFDVKTGRRSWSVEEAGGSHLVFSPQGKVILSSGPDRVIQLLRADTGASICRLQGFEEQVFAAPASAPDVRTATFTRDGLHILAACANAEVGVWNTKDGRRSSP